MKVFRLSATFVVFMTLALGRGCFSSQPALADDNSAETALRAALRADLTTYLRERKVAEHVSAASLSVSLRGRRTNIDVNAGTMEYGGGAPLQSNSLWQIGSNTKAFTAVTLLQLEAEHKLSIADTVGKWLPQYPAWSAITIKALLDMTSGIATYDEQPAFLTAYAAAPTADLAPGRLVAFAEGIPLQTGYNYTNTGYIMAEMIIEKVTHDTYAHQLTKRFIGPLALHDVFYSSDTYPQAVLGRMPAGYFYDASVKPFAHLFRTSVSAQTLSWARSAGGIVASMDDLTKWTRALYEGHLLAPAQQRELESLVSFKTGRPIAITSLADPRGFGLGVAQSTNAKLGTFWFYLGGSFGFRVLHLYFPRSGTIVAVGLNSAPAVDNLGTKLALSLYKTLHEAGRV